MTNLNSRELAFEAKFMAEKEKEFKAKAKRNIRLVSWVADMFGYEPSEKEEYVNKMLGEFLLRDVEQLADRMIADLEKNDKVISLKDILIKAEELLAHARKEVRGEA